MKMNNLFNSIRFKLILGLIVVVLPILSFLIYNNVYSIQLVRNQVAQSNSNLLQLYMGLIEKDLESIDAYLFPFVANDSGLNRMDLPSENNPDLYHLTRYQLFREMYERSSFYSIHEYLFVYSIINQDLLLAPNSSFVRVEGVASVNAGLLAIVQDPNKMRNISHEKWSSLQINNSTYLARMIKNGNVYVGALVNYNRIMRPLDLLDLGVNGTSLIVNADNEPAHDAAFYKETQIDLAFRPEVYQLTGKDGEYLVIGERSKIGDFSLVAVISDRSILENLPYTRRVIMAIAAGTILILIGALVLMRKFILQPINRILSAMRKLRNGQLEARIVNVPTSIEFQLMNETFNSMVSEIQKLKIDIYEEQLLSKKAELKQLQLQINPHFYLNSLNAFYHLSEDNNTKVIKELSLTLIKYFRFMFRSGNSDFVPLMDEVNHAGNYLRIQEFRFPDNLTYHFSVTDSLMGCNVPPLILQTFAENAVKHAVTLDEPVHIQITVQHDEAMPEERMRIQIRDTGNGFSEEILRQIEEGRSLMNDEGEHVGIWNVKRRLSLLYKERAAIAFYNDHGAVVEISLPL